MKLLLPETLAQKCHEWLPTSTLRSAITQCHMGCVYVLDEWCFISFYIHETTFLGREPLHMLLLRVIPSATEESWEWSAVLEAILWLSDYPCVPPASPSSLTSSLGLIVNRSCLLSDLVLWWYRPSAMPSFHLHFPSFLWAVTVSKCARVVQKPSKIRQTSENQLDVDAIIFKVFPLYWELLGLIVPVG